VLFANSAVERPLYFAFAVAADVAFAVAFAFAVAVAVACSSPDPLKIVISTEAAHGLIVSRAAEKPASLPKPSHSHAIVLQ
jgi:hypothetical protein